VNTSWRLWGVRELALKRDFLTRMETKGKEEVGRDGMKQITPNFTKYDKIWSGEKEKLGGGKKPTERGMDRLEKDFYSRRLFPVGE